MVCTLCGAELSDSEDLTAHYVSNCRSSSPGWGGSAGMAAREASPRTKKVNVVFRWLPYRNLPDKVVHLFGDKSLNKGNPLPLINSDSGGNFSSAQVSANVGEFVGCQLALEEGDMLPVQSFLVTERSTVIYLFPETVLGLAPTSASAIASHRQVPPVSSVGSVRRQASDDSDGSDLSDFMAHADAEAALQHSPPAAAVPRPGAVARAFTADPDLTDQARQRGDGAANGTGTDLASSQLSSLYREMLLHQIGKDDGLLSDQVKQESQHSHAVSEQRRSEETSVPKSSASSSKSRAGQPMRAMYQGNTPVGGLSSTGQPTRGRREQQRTHSPTSPKSMPVAGDSRSRASSLGSRRQGAITMAPSFSEPRRPRSDGGLPRASSPARTTSAAPVSASQGSTTASAIAAAMPSLPPKIDGRHTLVINEIRIMPSDSSAVQHTAERPGSAPVRRRNPPQAERDDDGEKFLWRPGDFRMPPPSIGNERRLAQQPPSTRPAAVAARPALSVGIFVPGQHNTTTASTAVNNAPPSAISLQPPAAVTSSSTTITSSSSSSSSVLDRSLAQYAATLPTTSVRMAGLVSSVTTISTPRVQEPSQLTAFTAGSSSSQVEENPIASLRTRINPALAQGKAALLPPATSLASIRTQQTRSSADGPRPSSVVSSFASTALGRADDSDSSGSSGSELALGVRNPAQPTGNLKHSDQSLSHSSSSLASILSSLPGLGNDQQLPPDSSSDAEREHSTQLDPSLASSGIAEHARVRVTEARTRAAAVSAAPTQASSAVLSAGMARGDANTILSTAAVTATSSRTAIPGGSPRSAATGSATAAAEVTHPTSASASSEGLQEKYALLEQNMVRQRAHLESQLRRRDETIESLQGELRQVQADQEKASTRALQVEVNRLQQILRATEVQNKQLHAVVQQRSDTLAQVEGNLAQSKQTEARQAEQLMETRSELDKAYQTVRAAMQLQEAHQRQSEELQRSKADCAGLADRNRELTESCRKQESENEKLMQLVAQVNEENKCLAQRNAAQLKMEQELMILRAERTKSLEQINRYEAEVGQFQVDFQKAQDAFRNKEAELTQRLVATQHQLQSSRQELAERSSAQHSQAAAQVVPAPNRSVAEECVKLRTENTALRAELLRIQSEADGQVAKLRQDLADVLRQSREGLHGESGEGGSSLLAQKVALQAQVVSLENDRTKTREKYTKVYERAIRYRQERDNYRESCAELKSQVASASPQPEVLTSPSSQQPSPQHSLPATASAQHADATDSSQRRHHHTGRTRPTHTTAPPVSIGHESAGRRRERDGGVSTTTAPAPRAATSPLVATRPAEEFLVAGNPDTWGLDRPPASTASQHWAATLPVDDQGPRSSLRRSRSLPRSGSSPTLGAGSPGAQVRSARDDRHHRSGSLERSLRSASSHSATSPHSRGSTAPRTHVYDLQVNEAVMVRRTNNEQHLGFIRYVGGLDGGAEGEFVGVELVDELGKNDGSQAGRRYFTCAPRRGIFVKRSRVEPLGPQEYQ